MTLSNREIQDTLLYGRDHEQLSAIEEQLRARLNDMTDGMTKADLMSLLLIASLKKNFIETDQIRLLTDEYLRLVREVSEDLKHPKKGVVKPTDVPYKIFVSLAERRCRYIETLLLRLRADRSADRVRILRYSLALALAYRERRYGTFAAFTLYRYSTLFGTSFVALIFCILINAFGFALIMYAYDVSVLSHAIPMTNLVSETGTLNSFDYYSYISLATLSNLGADTSFASNLFLRVLFGVEQIAGLVLFGLAIILLGRRFQ
jgi:hypothetical protein